MPSGVGVRADHAVLRPDTNRAAVLLIETDSKSLIGPKYQKFCKIEEYAKQVMNEK